MRYTQIRAFHQVALRGGFSRAAEALNMTQPSVSDQVKRLEKTYDTLLFKRDRRQIRLTAAGERLFRLTREFFEVEERIVETLDETRTAVTGELRIIADAAMHITQAVGAFRKSHPRVFVTMRAGNTEEVLQSLRSYEADVGVVGNIDEATDLDFVPLGEAPIIAVVRKGTELANTGTMSLCDLHDLPLIFRETGSRTRARLEQEATRQRIRLLPAMEAEGREAMRELVAAGAGVGFASAAEFGHDARLLAVPIEGLSLQMSESVVTLTARRDVPVIRSFLKTLERS
ncbi:MAG: LysR substrate-binding domain-containing protein [Pseudomonadota bacterium]